jgi:hypothetical protein
MASSCIDVAISHCPFGCNPWQLSLTPRSTGDVDGLDDGGGAPRSEQHLDEHLRPQPKVHLDRDTGKRAPCRPKMELGSYRETALDTRELQLRCSAQAPGNESGAMEFMIPSLDSEMDCIFTASWWVVMARGLSPLNNIGVAPPTGEDWWDPAAPPRTQGCVA